MSRKILKVVALAAVIFLCSAVAQTDPPDRDTLVKDNGIKQYSEYQTGLKQLQTSGYKDPGWFDFWKASVSDPSTLDGPSYYLRIRGNVSDSNYTTFGTAQVASPQRFMLSENVAGKSLIKQAEKYLNP